MPDKVRFFYGYVIVILSFIVMMLILGLHTSFGIFFKPIITELEWTRAVTSGAFSLSQVLHGVLGITMGWLNDRFGPRLVVTICGLLSTLGYLLMSQVYDVWQLYVFYGVMIGAGSTIFVPLLSTVARWFVGRRSLMTGVVFGGVGVGMLVLPPVVNRLIAAYSWRGSFLVLSIVILIVIVSSAQFLKRDPGRIGQTPYGASEAVPGGLKSERQDMTLREAVHSRPFWLFAITLVFYGFVFFALQVHIVPYVTDLGISTSSAAIILTTTGGATIVGQIGLGSYGDRIGYKRAFLIGVVLIALAIFTLMLARELWVFFLFAVFLGLAFGDCSTQESPIAAWLFGLKSHGLIFGFFGFSFTVGAAIGPVLSGYIFDVTGSYELAFLVCAVLAVVAVILTIFLKQPGPPGRA